MNKSEMEHYLIAELLRENSLTTAVPLDETARQDMLRELFNVRPAMPIKEQFLTVQDEYLRLKSHEKGITDIVDLTPIRENLYVWQGDITTLRCDAIVNAANSKMLGCFVPGHACIDNAIHTFAGVQLRLECDKIMEKQGHDEPTGTAKITKAYNLPCRYVIHTVGPIVKSELSEKQSKQLASCYRSCLEIAIENRLESIAFCCISTGVYGFPQQEAAEIAVSAIAEILQSHPIKVIFNVFEVEDLRIYKKILTL